jgi:putative iron-dependent peroxidase
MLTNMFLGTAAAAHDRVLDFSNAVTGCLFFVPTVDMLEDPPVPGAEDGTDDSEVVAAAPGDGSLGLGSLRGCER